MVHTIKLSGKFDDPTDTFFTGYSSNTNQYYVGVPIEEIFDLPALFKEERSVSVVIDFTPSEVSVQAAINHFNKPEEVVGDKLCIGLDIKKAYALLAKTPDVVSFRSADGEGYWHWSPTDPKSTGFYIHFKNGKVSEIRITPSICPFEKVKFS